MRPQSLFTTLTLTTLCTLYAGSASAYGMMGNKKGGGGKKQQQAEQQEMQGQGTPEMRAKAKAFIPPKATREMMKRFGFIATGLSPVYPETFSCPQMGSGFATPYRTDGSSRSRRFFQGLHGGFDIPQAKGVPLIAMADGELILRHEGQADGIGGKGIWMRHSPEQTGLDKWLFIEYKHLDKLPDLEEGAMIRMGQPVGETGNSGTTGGHYGAAGFYHLHMTAFWSDSPEFSFKRVLIPKEGEWLDPLALFRGGSLDSNQLKALPSDQKAVPIHFISSDGSFHPAGTRIIWPYACSPKS
ncbi:M23 family metallopeptidase [uncultured Neptuniibacter sp.]|uniref:M23 family metallopeptidase n=1 Tax=uncultured Neptuniibacter sp. TaxID=502143 RepID=UPI00260288F4|nr:M23 family metallopeptidase [uncultured Neptuniibacter sp.]